MDLEEGTKRVSTSVCDSNSQTHNIESERYQSQSHARGTSLLSPKAQADLQRCRTETGFSSYRAYLEFHKEHHSSLNELSEAFQAISEQAFRERLSSRWQGSDSAGSVLSVTKDWGLLTNDPSRSDDYGTEIIETFCHPPEGTQLQIVLWNVLYPRDLRFREDLIDFLGLRSEIDPRIFESMLAIAGRHRTNHPGWDLLERYHPTHMTAGKSNRYSLSI